MSSLEAILTAGERGALGQIEHAIRRAVPAPAGPLRVIDHERLRPHVYRLRLAAADAPRSIVLKRLRPEQGARERLLVRRLLPAAGVGWLAPPLRAFAVEREGERAWHVYDDLGDVSLAGGPLTPARLEPVVDAMAGLHRAFARHPELGPWRGRFGDLGIHYLEAGVRAGVRLLGALPLDLPRARRARPVREGLLERLRAWAGEIDERAAALRALDPDPTLVHGDCHGRNALLVEGGAEPRVRIIDWDHAAVGYGIFDLATFVEELPVELRAGVVERYRRARYGGALAPTRAAWNRMLDTARIARFADEVVWDCLAVFDGEVDYGLGKLAMWLEAIEAMTPLLPPEDRRAERAPAPDPLP